MTFTFIDRDQTERTLFAVGVPVDAITEAADLMERGRKINAVKVILDAAGGQLTLRESKAAALKLVGPASGAEIGELVSHDHGVTWVHKAAPPIVKPAIVG